MDATGDDHTKWSTKRERRISCDIPYMWSLKYDTNEYVYEIDSQTIEQTCGSQGWGGQERDRLGI